MSSGPAFDLQEIETLYGSHIRDLCEAVMSEGIKLGSQAYQQGYDMGMKSSEYGRLFALSAISNGSALALSVLKKEVEKRSSTEP